MARPLRLEFPNALYHIISPGNRRGDIFLDDDRFFSGKPERIYKLMGVLIPLKGTPTLQEPGINPPNNREIFGRIERRIGGTVE